MNEPVQASPSFFRKFWSLSVTATLMVSMLFMLRFFISVMSENRKIFLDAGSLHLGQTQREVTVIMGTPDQIESSDDSVCYRYGEKQKKMNEILNWIDATIGRKSPGGQTRSGWPVAVQFDENGKSIMLKKGPLIIH